MVKFPILIERISKAMMEEEVETAEDRAAAEEVVVAEAVVVVGDVEDKK